MIKQVPHPMSKVVCSVPLEPGSIGGGPRQPLVKRMELIVVEFDDRRQFFTDDGLLIGDVRSPINYE